MSVQGASIDPRWYSGKREEAHKRLWAMARRIREQQQPRREMYQFFMDLYGGDTYSAGLMGFDPHAVSYVPPQCARNVVRSGVQTIAARISKEKPLPVVLTNDGEYLLQKRARRLTKAIEGTFNATKLFRYSQAAAIDALLFGMGVLRFYRHGKRAIVERVFPWEILVDVADSQYGEPRSCYMTRWMDRHVLADMFPSKRALIMSSSRGELIDNDIDIAVTRGEDRQDRILVVEGWHLPSGEDADDGRHTIAVVAGSLLDETWERDSFPFAIIRYENPIAGFYGEGLAAEMAGYQLEIAEIAERRRIAFYLASGGLWMNPDTSGVPDADFNNEIGCVLTHRPGMAPQHINVEPMHEQFFRYHDTLISEAFQQSGVPETWATSRKESGVTAAVAINTLNDNHTTRFALFADGYEQLHVDAADQLLWVLREIAEEYPKLLIRTPRGKGFVDLKWDDVDLERDQYQLQTFPTALLAKTPAARLQQVQDLFNAGVIDRPTYFKLINAPDLESEMTLEQAARELADSQIEWMMDHDDPFADDAYQYPEPASDLVYAMHRAQIVYCRGKLQKVPQPNLDLLLDYIEDAKFELGKRIAANAPPPANDIPPEEMGPNEGAPPVGLGAPPGVPPLAGEAPGPIPMTEAA